MLPFFNATTHLPESAHPVRFLTGAAGLSLVLLGLAGAAAAQPFSLNAIEHALPGVKSGDAAWGDVDNDGDLDLFLSGVAEAGRVVAALYRNEGENPETQTVQFVEVEGSIAPFCFSSVAWGDYDGDGDLDLAAVGSRNAQVPYEPVSQLFRNENGTLVRVADVDFVHLHSGAVAWGDVDNDGDLDLLLSGSPAVAPPFDALTRLYLNNGAGGFSAAEIPLTGLAFGSATWGDYDADGDLDLVHTGANTEGFQTLLYRNTGGDLVPVEADLPQWAFSDADFGDYDEDGDLDLLINGAERDGFSIFSGTSRLYRNDGEAGFVAADLPLVPTLSGGAQWGDYDSDGDLDLLVMGAEDPFGRYAARVYRSNGEAGFNEEILLVGLVQGRAAWGDYDRDGDLDLLTIGRARGGAAVTALYRNTRTPTPQDVIPVGPTPQPALVDRGTVTLTWTFTEDARPASQHPTYNLRVWNEAGSPMPAHADPATGLRHIAAPGNVRHQTTWTLDGLAPGTYRWGVQTVSGAFVGSPFAEGETFTVAPTAVDTESDAALPTRYALHPAYPNPFSTTTTLQADMPRPGRLRVTIVDVLGRQVQTLYDAEARAGVHRLTWTGKHIGAGMYFVVMEAGRKRFSHPVMRVN